MVTFTRDKCDYSINNCITQVPNCPLRVREADPAVLEIVTSSI
jgi:hypothetical protein